MAYRLPSERVTLTIEDGPTVEVEKVHADLIYQLAVGLLTAAAKKPEQGPLSELYAFFVPEAQPSWDIADHRGPIQPTTAGMLRLPVKLGLQIVMEWAETFIEKETAVDKIIPPGKLRDDLNHKLRSVA